MISSTLRSKRVSLEAVRKEADEGALEVQDPRAMRGAQELTSPVKMCNSAQIRTIDIGVSGAQEEEEGGESFMLASFLKWERSQAPSGECYF
jgi:hypothetical protein